MSSLIISVLVFVWHFSWNLTINKALGHKTLSWVHILLMSLLIGLLSESVYQLSKVSLLVVISFFSLLYYINLIHVRFFGHLIPWVQIKEFFSKNKTTAAGGDMLVQALKGLMKSVDLILLFVYVITATGIIFFKAEVIISVYSIVAINIVLVSLIILTCLKYREIKEGRVNPYLFGVFFSYYFAYLNEQKRKEQHENLFKMFEEEKDHDTNFEESQQKEERQKDEFFGKWKGKNVILIQLESFQQFLIHHKVNGQEVTPFLNRMARENIQFTEVYSQFAMGHTVDAEFAALHSLYPLKNEIINFKHFDKKYRGLAHIFKENNYETAALHGFKGDFYNRRIMMKTHGFDSFYAEEDFNSSERASTWMSDSSFFKQSVDKIKNMKEPFFSFMISLTSHFPFELEQKYWGLKLEKDQTNFMSRYYQSANYTDRALEHFYNQLVKEGLHKNTVFAFYGDHEGVTLENLPELFDILEFEQMNILKTVNQQRAAKVPFILSTADPDQVINLSSPKIGSTLDISQTLLHLMGLPEISYAMGESLFTSSPNRTIPLIQFPLGSFVSKDFFCYASSSGNYSESTFFDRKINRMILPVSGEKEKQFDFSKQQIIKSEYLITGDLLIGNQSEKEGDDGYVIDLNSKLEELLSIADHEAIIIPVSRNLEMIYTRQTKDNPSVLHNLEKYYFKQTNRNVKFFSTINFENNIKDIFFEDPQYIDLIRDKGYFVDHALSISLESFLDNLPDDVCIVVTAKDDASNQINEAYHSKVEKFGISKLKKGLNYRFSYINLIYKNKGFTSFFEEGSITALELHLNKNQFFNGFYIPFNLSAISKGALVGNRSEINVNGVPYSLNMRGLNIVVVDMKTSKILKSVRADTYSNTTVNNGMYRATKSEAVDGG
ncbi:MULTISPECIES: LTA synthase family protein [Paenibacillus]|uniref:Sulfatase-like hydrolase/transferase n=1 Tax=Paenibacillus xylanilyticus TaxID=248903 RepID=A0A7Y6ETR4_9BACL|nr:MULTISPECIES: sulfatase-like hydrolase/transferase [Paenibacillus]MBE7681612.1 sulfatase-like hydrolase/transferase [Paenibacillus sp. P13VS]NUU74831.1 sulfatase-like hydrolase/transferase [Paenibacillus xylanilyticus]